MVADAQFGDILSVTPALNSASRLFPRGPRIIHVPQADAKNRNEFANDRVSINNRDELDEANHDDNEQAASSRCAGPKTARRYVVAPTCATLAAAQ